MLMKSVEIAYIAGIVDSEGCITTAKKYGGAIWVIIGINHRETLEWIASFYGGTVHRATFSLKQMWRWEVKSVKAKRLLVDIYPYLREKKAQATLALRINEYSERYGHSRKPEDVVVRVQELTNQLRELKR
jgi:hypothetical protein